MGIYSVPVEQDFSESKTSYSNPAYSDPQPSSYPNDETPVILRRVRRIDHQYQSPVHHQHHQSSTEDSQNNRFSDVFVPPPPDSDNVGHSDIETPDLPPPGGISSDLGKAGESYPTEGTDSGVYYNITAENASPDEPPEVKVVQSGQSSSDDLVSMRLRSEGSTENLVSHL